jgi:hypothetical protein
MPLTSTALEFSLVTCPPFAAFQVRFPALSTTSTLVVESMLS